MSQSFRFFYLTLLLINALSAEATSPTPQQLKHITAEAFQRMERTVTEACNLNMKFTCSAKKCLKEDNPKECYRAVMASETFEDKIADYKAKCEKLNDAWACGFYCSSEEAKSSSFCKELKEKTAKVSAEQHLEACRQGMKLSCSEYCQKTVKINGDGKSYSSDLMHCEINARRK